QTGLLTGTVQDANTARPLIAATVTIDGLSINTQTDSIGNYKIALPVGTYKVAVSSIGYSSEIKYNIVVSSGNPQLVNFYLQGQANTLKEVSISFNRAKSAVATDLVTPLSVQQLTTEEIKSNP